LNQPLSGALTGLLSENLNFCLQATLQQLARLEIQNLVTPNLIKLCVNSLNKNLSHKVVMRTKKKLNTYKALNDRGDT